MSNDLPKITDLQKRWVEAYVGPSRFNATDAARRAGYKDANQSGYLNRINSDVYAHVRAWLDAHALGSEEVLAELRDVAMAEWHEFITVKYGKEGDLLDVRMDLRSKVHALELLAKHHRLLIESVNVSGSIRREYVVVPPEEPDTGEGG